MPSGVPRTIILAVLLGSVLFAQETGEILVLGSDGWKSPGGAVLKPKDTLRPNTALTGPAPGKELILSCGRVWRVYTCQKAGCVVPVCAESAEAVTVRRIDPGGWNEPKPGFLDMAAALFRREPRTGMLATLGVRGTGNLTDAVVRLEGGSISLAPALARVLEGSYCFKLSPLPARTAPPHVVTLDWNRDDEGKSRATGVTAGLYAITRGTPGAGGCKVEDADAAGAWVLAVGGSDYQRVASQWQSYEPGLKQLADGSGPDVAALMRHAILASLADSLR